MFLKMLFLFMVYAIVGWLWETPYVSLSQKKFVNRGFLRGPYIPIYGLACLTIILSTSIFDGFNSDSIGIVILQILFIGLISAVWEYVTSWSLEVMFKTRWWDYSKHRFNLNGRIALDYTILFGLGGFILLKFVNPVFLNLYSTISEDLLLTILVLFYTVFAVDSYLTLRDLFSLRSIIIKLNHIRSELAVLQDSLVDRVHHRTVISKDYISELVLSLQELREKRKEKISDSLDKQISNIQTIFRNSKNISRLFNKFPRTPFHLLGDIKEKLNRKK